ncbi:MAG: fibronectin type III domain-containing protein [Thermoplasmata archaeon]
MPFAILLGTIVVVSLWASLTTHAVPVSITVPLSSNPVSDADLDGDPATGAWGDALRVDIPLENGEAAPYGVAVLYAKHDGSNLYFRIDGAIDVAWVAVADDYFWLGIQVSPTQTSHHGGGSWDGTFFGLWNGDEYVPQPAYPPRAVDTHGFDRPPLSDTLQDVLGTLRYSGTQPPYSFTAEWRRPLDSGDQDDLSYEPDGVTSYNFFVTTDSDGGGSFGGSISHRMVTNLNAFKVEPTGPAGIPPTIVHSPPEDAVTGEAITLAARVVDADGVADARVNYTDVTGAFVNASMSLEGPMYVYTLPAQNASGTIIYFLWATDPDGNEARTILYNVPVTKLLPVLALLEVAPSVPGCLLVTWEEGPGLDLAGYRLYRWNTSVRAMEEVIQLPEDSTSYEDCGLESDEVYTYWILSFDDEGNESPPSVMVNGRTSAPTESAPAAPAVLVALAIVAGLAALAVLAALVIVMVLPRLRPPKGGRESS